jgi:hypothetical protein
MTDSTGANEILQNDKPWRAIILTSEMEMQVHRGTTSNVILTIAKLFHCSPADFC